MKVWAEFTRKLQTNSKAIVTNLCEKGTKPHTCSMPSAAGVSTRTNALDSVISPRPAWDVMLHVFNWDGSHDASPREERRCSRKLLDSAPKQRVAYFWGVGSFLEGRRAHRKIGAVLVENLWIILGCENRIATVYNHNVERDIQVLRVLLRMPGTGETIGKHHAGCRSSIFQNHER